MSVPSSYTSSPDDAAAGAWQLTLRGLRIFLALEEAGSVAGAAERLGTSASGISQHITTLEKAVGARLFDRRARPIAPTPAGRALSRHARRIIAAVSEAETDLAAFSLGSVTELNLAIIDDLDTTMTPALVSSLLADYPRFFVNAFSGRSDHILGRLERREADICLTASVPGEAHGFLALPILRESFLLVLARGAQREGETPREAIGRLPFVRYSETIPIGQKVALMLRRARIAPPRRFAFETTRSVMSMVAECGGWAVTTPLNLMDAETQLDAIEVMRLPFAGEQRHVHLLARTGELGRLPHNLAGECRRIVRDRLAPRFDALVPVLAGAISVEEDEGEESAAG